MRVALVLCPAWSIEMPHLATAILSACLRRNEHKVFTFDLNSVFYHSCIKDYKVKWSKEQDLFWTYTDFITEFVSENEEIINHAVKEILATEAQIIGFSVYYPNELMSLELARRIKKMDKHRVIVFGGFQCAREVKGKRLIKEEAVDIVVMGEGEQTLSELVIKFEENGSIDFCKGILLKKNDDVIDCSDREPIIDLDNLPFPDFTDFSLSLYKQPHSLPLLFSRGCFQRCVYCTVNSFWKRYRSMSADRMFQEIKHLLSNFNNKVTNFHLYDPLLNGNIKELSKFCDLIIDNVDKEIITPIRWRGLALIRPEMTSGLLEKMKKAGCDYLSYGMETGSQNVIDKMKKNFKITDAERVIQHTYDVGIFVGLHFMFGFPGETEEDFDKTLDFLKRNREYIYEVVPSESFCYIAEGTYLYEHAEEFGINSHPHSDFWESIDGKNIYPERLRRFEIFCELASALNIKVGSGYDKVKIFKQQSLDKYYAHRNGEKKNLGILPKDDKPRSLYPKNQVTLSWDIHYKCNFRCPYCWFYRDWANMVRRNIYLSSEQWIVHWKRIYDKYGEVKIEIVGGEPFIYPNFIELVKKISSIHLVKITTNLSGDIERFVREINPERVDMDLNFHMLFIDLETFLKRTLILKRAGFKCGVCYLAYPPQMYKIKYLSERFQKEGINFALAAFWGEYDGKKYPDSYTEKEKEIMQPFLGDINRFNYHLNAQSPRGKLCNAGYRYASIQADGNVVRCGSLTDKSIGNILDENFQLFNSPLPCESDFCPCNEYVNLAELDKAQCEPINNIEKVSNKIIEQNPILSSSNLSLRELETLKVKENQSVKFSPSHKIFWNWDIHYSCNYRCSYCFCAGKWEIIKSKNRYPDIKELGEIWDRIFGIYGSCHIHISGGEPFIYPNFIDLVSLLLKKHTLEFTTNLSFDVNLFMQQIVSQGVKFNASFHPEFENFAIFLKKVMLLIENNFSVDITYVAYPPYLERMKEFKDECKYRGINFGIQPFRGTFQGKPYPSSYSEEERRLLKICSEFAPSVDYFIENKNNKKEKRLCHMGHMYAKIMPSGDVLRCCAEDVEKIGNLFDDKDFSLLNEPLPCEIDNCPCWKRMIVGEEDKWMQLWKTPI